MRKICFIFLGLFIFVFNANAKEQDLYEQSYKIVNEEYVLKVNLLDLMIKGFEGLKPIDDKVKVGTIPGKIVVYYDNYTLRSYPIEKYRTEQDFGKLTSEIIKIYTKKSPKLKIKDFEISERFLYSMFSSLDADTKYIPYLDIGLGNNSKRQRYFVKDILEDNVLYMKLGPLNNSTKDAVLNALVEHSDYSGIILDLRGNPGGLIREAISVMNIFLDEGIIVSTRGINDEEESFYIADGTSQIDDRPLVVLVDMNTASSAEILASTIQEQSLGKLVGSRTRGKGTIQSLVFLENGSEIAMTSSFFFSPSGSSVHKTGVLPDVCTAYLDDRLTVPVVLSLRQEGLVCAKEDRSDKDMDVLVALEMING